MIEIDKIYRGLKEKYDSELHVIYVTTDTNELIIGDQSLGQSITNWNIANGKLTLETNTGTPIEIQFPDATETESGLLSPEDKAQLNSLQNNLDSLIVKVTQEEFDAIQVKKSNTLYVVS